MANYLASAEQYNPADTWSRADSMATARSLPPPTRRLAVQELAEEVVRLQLRVADLVKFIESEGDELE